MTGIISELAETFNSAIGVLGAGIVGLAIMNIVQGIRISILTTDIETMMKHLGVEEEE